jgi:lipopolysaccharide heptosyltransferase II
VIIDPSKVRRILVIKLRAIGDVLLSTAVLPNLKAFFPEATIDFLTERFCAPVIRGNPAVTSIIEFDPATQGGVSLIHAVRSRSYDLVIDLFGNPRSAIVSLLSGAGVRAGYRFSWRRHCYTHVLEPRGGEVHNVEFNLDALRGLEIPVTTSGVTFPIPGEAHQFASRFIEQHELGDEILVALNPGGGWDSKRWPADHIARLGERITREFPTRLIVVWGPGEENLARSIASAIPRNTILAPRTTLKELGALLGKCHLVVTNDTGPMHIAAAVGTRVVAVFGPTRPELQGPVGHGHTIVRNDRIACLGCNYTACPIGTPCMNDLTVEDVFQSLRGVLAEIQSQHESSRP